ncbi:MAG TPA: adenylate/guanylate cyclase domain-containing protein, partial [Vicinamibacteria bacterium]|nr:adenylate/guanylate cyclase domain-containing protein [Vicinamibacteria bacterium]
ASLFWLAHSRDVAECLRELEGKTPAVRKLKYSLHPLLSSFYRRLEDTARKAAEQEGAGVPGSDPTTVVDSIIDDGFAFTEPTITDLDFNLYLAHNKRYRISADLFFEIYTILVRDTERRLREGDRGLLARVARHLPRLTREQCQTQAGVVKVMMNAEVLPYLLGDAWSVGTRLTASPRLRAETERRRPAEVVDVFLDLLAGVKRFEVIAYLRDRVRLLRAFDDEREMEHKASRGQRFYEFGDSAQVINNAANATIFFLDLRGFTQTSEGQISERDLTRELYTVFDAFIPHVRRFGGTVDKFLGDGIMVTYGTEHADPLNPLNALRTAVLCQETLRRLRAEGQTYFKMGIAVHYGRVYLARFLADDTEVQTTVIGRTVNLAGRLSSASRRSVEEDEPGAEWAAPPSGAAGSEFLVSLEPDGTLVNEGIAISRDTLQQLETHLPLVHTEGALGQNFEYFDDQIGRRLIIRYAGDAKFKGVRSSFPVYCVDFEG